jgi:multidrug efflux pump subunit AcrB
LPNGASLKATEAQAKKVEALLAEPEMSRSVKIFASYLGNGSPRFYLPLDQQLFNDNFAQFVIMTHDIAAREDLKRRLEQRFADAMATGAACERACCASKTVRRSVFRSSSAFPATTSASCGGSRPASPR